MWEVILIQNLLWHIKNNDQIGKDFIYFSEIKEINKIIDESQNFSDNENFYIQILLEKYFNENQYEEIRDFHYNLSKSTGRYIGLYEEKQDKENIIKKSFMNKFNKYKNKNSNET
jgi:hypothetical protein